MTRTVTILNLLSRCQTQTFQLLKETKAVQLPTFCKWRVHIVFKRKINVQMYAPSQNTVDSL